MIFILTPILRGLFHENSVHNSPWDSKTACLLHFLLNERSSQFLRNSAFSLCILVLERLIYHCLLLWKKTVINYVNTYLICCGSGQFYSVLLHWLSRKYQPFQFGNGKDFIYSLEIFFYNVVCVSRMGGSEQEITSCRLEGPTCREWPANKLHKCWGTVGILLGW